jgi:hypothetical protein
LEGGKVVTDTRTHWTVAKVYPHHKPRNVKLTNNLTRDGDAGARKEGRFVLPLPFAPWNGHQKTIKPDAATHHETSMQAASRALDRMLAAGLVKPIVVRAAPRSTWNPDRPRKSAPHHKARNVRMSNALAGTAGSSTAARMTEREWEALKAKFPRRKAHDAFNVAARALERMQQPAAFKQAA